MIRKLFTIFFLFFLGSTYLYAEEIIMTPDEQLSQRVALETINNQNTKPTPIKINGKFSHDLFSGGANFSYPIQVPKGQRDLTPRVSLSYSSHSRDMLSPYGYGWNLNTQSIFRSTNKGISNLYNENDFTARIGGASYELSLVDEDLGLYMPKEANNLSKFFKKENGWKVYDASGNIYYFGMNSINRQIDSENPDKIFSWVLEKKEDVFGNKLEYKYIISDNNIYLDRIEYVFTGSSPLYQIKFNYSGKSVSNMSNATHFKVQNFKALTSIETKLKNAGNWETIKSYNIGYNSLNSVIYHLISIQEQSGEKILPITSFTYNTTGVARNLLSEINNGQGGKTLLKYLPSTSYRTGAGIKSKIPFILKTLNEVENIDAITGVSSKTTYEYAGGHYYFDHTDVFGREYAGFNEVDITDAKGNITKVYHHQSHTQDNSEQALKGEYNDHISKKGKVYREETYDNNDNLYTTKIIKWEHKDLGDERYQVFPTRETQLIYDGTATHTDTVQSYSYDSYGNIVENIHYGEVEANANIGTFTDVGTDSLKTTMIYAINTSKNLFHNLSEMKVFDNNDVLISHSETRYDNLGKGQIEKGLVTKKRNHKLEDNSIIDTNVLYNLYGLPVSQTDPKGNITTMSYDSYNLFPITITNPKLWTETYDYDYRYSKPNSKIDINGVNHKTTYDGFGRTLSSSVIHPDTTEIVLQTTNYVDDSFPHFVEQTIQGGSDITQDRFTRTYFNGFGEVIQTKSSAKNSLRYITSKVRYDSLGNKEFVTYPRYENFQEYSEIEDIEKGNTSTYDLLKRVLTQTNKSGTISYIYNDFTTQVTNQNGVKKSYTINIFGSLVEVQEYNENDVYTTKYEYSPLQKLTKITDAEGNVRNMNYDSLNRQTTIEDLHKTNDTTFGVISYEYDTNSNIIKKINQADEELVYDYDELNRVVKTSLQPSPQGEGVATDYFYDNGNYSQGQLTSVIKNGFTQSWKYNFLGQQIEEVSNYGTGAEYITSYNYTPRGEILSITYPDSTKINHGYVNGYLNTLKNGDDFIITDLTYSPTGIYSTIHYGNSIITSNTFDYDNGYRLSSKRTFATGENTQLYQDIDYEFDTVGNITQIADNGPTPIAKVSTYTYDDLERLLTSNYVYPDTTSDSYAYTYNSLGNILSNKDVGDYSYDEIGYANPHAVTSITNSGSTSDYTYDKKGNLINKSFSGSTENYDFDINNMMTQYSSPTGNTEYRYDSSGRRFLKIGSGTITKYVNRYYEEEDDTISRYIFLGDTKIATIETKETNTGSTLIYHHSDHLGGASIDTDTQGNILQSSDYKPFGEVRKVDQTTEYENKYLFGGKEEDTESGLQYFEARYYDNTTGRFESIDRVFWVMNGEFVLNPQLQNAYTYVGNNPLKYVDPSGEWLKNSDATAEFDRYIEKGKSLNYSNKFTFNGFKIAGGFVEVKSPFSTLSNTLPEYLIKTAPNGYYDIKRSEDFKIEGDIKSNQEVGINGKKYLTSELGNFLVGLNGYRSGLTLKEIKNYGLSVEGLKLEQGNGAIGDELNDQNYYRAGYIYGILENSDEYSEKQLSHAKDYLLKKAKNAEKNDQ